MTRIYVIAAAVVCLGAAALWLRTDAANDREAQIRAAAIASDAQDKIENEERKNEIKNLDADAALDAVNRWLPPAGAD